MKRMSKFVASILLCALLLSAFAAPCFAASPPVIYPQWDNIWTMDLVVAFLGSAGNASGTLTKQSGVTRVEGTLTVYEFVGNAWVYVDSVYKSTTRNLAISVDFAAVSGVQYKAVFDATAYRGTVGENFVITRYKTCP